MQVNVIGSNAVPGMHAEPPARVRSAQDRVEEVVFDSASGLKQALEQHPEVRAEEVARGIELMGDANYPPTEVIGGISRLIASQIFGEPTG